MDKVTELMVVVQGNPGMTALGFVLALSLAL